MQIPEGIDKIAFERALLEPPVVSIKINRRKCDAVETLGYGSLEPVQWCDSGFYLDERPKFTLNPLLHAGVFYVQDASSMIHETIVGKLLQSGDLPVSDLRVLDLCAAPGGKTTSMINALPDNAIVVANEVMPKRNPILVENLAKWGFPNTIVTRSKTSDFGALGPVFDLVAVDAPCSGEGMMRKDQTARDQWSPGLVAQCAMLQKEILDDAVRALKPGGILIYSTCTFNTSENEDNVRYLVETHGLEPLDLEFPEEWGIGAQLNSPYPSLRFMPHLTRGEGLFAAVLRKPDDGYAASVNSQKFHAKIQKSLRVVKNEPKPGRPDETAPLRLDFDRSAFPMVNVDLDTALKYLRRETLVLASDVPKGFAVVAFEGYPLGFVKNLGARANNLYPNEWKIRI